MAKKVVLILAGVLVAAGLILLVSYLASNQWVLTFSNGKTQETVTREVAAEFSKLRIEADTADIHLALSEDGVCRLECTESENETYVIEATGDTLTVRKNDARKWYQFFSFGFSREETLTVYLPRTEFDALEIEGSTGDIEIPQGFAFADISIATSTGDVSCRARSEGLAIATSTGDITVADVSAGNIALAVSTGRVKISNVTCVRDISVAVSTGRTELSGVQCRNLTSTGSTGRLMMTDVIASGKLSAERSTGDVEFHGCDAAEIYVETTTGDVGGTLLTEKIFFTDTDTGDVRVPKTTTGGKCEITTTTGDIEIGK